MLTSPGNSLTDTPRNHGLTGYPKGHLKLACKIYCHSQNGSIYIQCRVQRCFWRKKLGYRLTRENMNILNQHFYTSLALVFLPFNGNRVVTLRTHWESSLHCWKLSPSLRNPRTAHVANETLQSQPQHAGYLEVLFRFLPTYNPATLIFPQSCDPFWFCTLISTPCSILFPALHHCPTYWKRSLH